MMSEARMMEAIGSATAYVRERLQGRRPTVGIILGSGLGSMADRIADTVEIAYADIPGFPLSTAIGHKGSFLCGSLCGKCVLAMQGRFHYYEGYTMQQVTLPVRVMAELGVGFLFVSNAAGGCNPGMHIGDIMLIRDHISFLTNPLVGPNLSHFGPRFPDMTAPYDLPLLELARKEAESLGITVTEGVYASCSGPSYETPAEYNYFRAIGADSIGMSTIPEVIVARHCGIRVFGVSVITDLAPDMMPEGYVTDENEIVKAAAKASVRMTALFERMISRLP